MLLQGKNSTKQQHLHSMHACKLHTMQPAQAPMPDTTLHAASFWNI
jgi:hypothetical protein